MPTVAEIDALAYTGATAFSSGMTAEDFRREYRKHGRPVRWWKALHVGVGNTGPGDIRPEANGYCFIEQETLKDGETALAGLKVAIFWSTQGGVPHQEFGYVRMDSTEVGVLPDEIELSRMDRLCPADVSVRRNVQITKVSGTHDLLPFKPVAEIVSIMANGVVLSAASYEVEARGIHWLSAIPSVGTKLIVEYRDNPLFEVTGTDKGLMQKGADDLYLPQRCMIQALQPDDNIATY